MGSRSYRMDIDAFESATGDLPLELEGAFLRLTHHVLRREGPVRASLQVLSRLWRCHPNKARHLLGGLLGTGLVTERDGRLYPSKRHIGRRTLPASVRARVFERDGEVCAYCGTTETPFEIDHVVCVADGGSDDPANLCVACVPCNRSKGSKTLEDWL